MSSVNRSTSRGGKGLKTEPTSKSSKTDTKTDLTKSIDHNPKVQEQILMAKMIETKSEDPDIKDKIKQVMDATRKTEDEVTTALHDCDNDPDRAVNMILEGYAQGEWETTEKKKKKNRQASSSKTDAAANRDNSGGGGGGTTEDDWADTSTSNNREPANTERDRPRQRGGPPRMRARGGGNQDNRGWRGRENKENEKNLEDGIGGGGSGSGGGGGYNRRGRSMNGPMRSSRGGRGGGRLGPRTFQSRSGGGDSGGRGSGGGGGTFSRPIETWNSAEQEQNDSIKMEDWDNEEYTGSLADTKVFTPSAHVVDQSVSTTVGVGTDGNVQPGDLDPSSQPPLASSAPVPPPTQSHVSQGWYQNSGSGPTPLNAAQTEYLTQLTQQSETYKSAASVAVATVAPPTPVVPAGSNNQPPPSTVPVTQAAPSLVQSAVQTGGAPSSATGYSTGFQTTTPSSAYASSGYPASSYSATSTYATHAHILGNGPGNVDASSAPSAVQMPPQRVKNLRPRVPPPSKIPATAVEMPGDAINSSIGYLDVQFGALEFGSDSGPFDGVGEPVLSSTASQNQQPQQSVTSSSVQQQQQVQVQPPQQQQQQVQATQVSATSATVSATGSNKYPGLDQMPSPRPSVPPASVADVSGLDAFAAVAAAAAATSNVQKTQNTLTTALGAQKLTDSMLAAEAHKQSQPPTSVGTATVYGSSSRDLDKTDANSGLASAYSNQTTAVPYQTYQAAQAKTPAAAYQPASSYNSNYSSNQVISTTAYPSSYSSTATNGATVPTGAYPSAGSNANSGYGQTAVSYGSSASSNQAFPQPNQSTTYPAAATVTGVVNNAGAAGPYAASNQVPYQNSYAATTAPNHAKLSATLNTVAKDNQFDTTTSTSNLGNNTIATSATSGVSGAGSGTVAGNAVAGNTGAGSGSGNSGPGASSSQTVNTTSTKVTSSTGSRRSSTSSSAWPYGASTTTDHLTLSAGVPPILGTHQYIMGQGGMPYFQQPMFSYEELQIIQQQRLPHMTSGHYDVGLPFQAPTSLATGREAGLANVAAYSMSDGRYTRTDSNASPVPSTLSQQNATQHQQPLINPTAALPPGYAYFYGAGMVPTGGFQYGTPAIYPQMPPATNSTSNSQYGKPGTGYGSGYGSGYDGLAQSQDYGKQATGYAVSGTGSVSKSTAAGVANAAAAAVAAAAGSTSNDPLSATMLYGKQHAALVGKVNSYEKQGFHSGTPPPFNLAGSQTAMAAPSGAFTPHVFIPTMAAPHQQHHSTTLTTLMHQPPLQESGTSSSQRSQASSQPNKSAAKQAYAPSYWTAN